MSGSKCGRFSASAPPVAAAVVAGHRHNNRKKLESLRTSGNIVSKLRVRETFGRVSEKPGGRATIRLFTRLPGRMVFCLKDVVPKSALVSGHIFLGFSKCGQFLMSYTQTAVDMEVSDSVDFMGYHYRLHWWLFVPYRKAKKIAEVMLFTNEGAPGNLHLSFCQWANDPDRAVIYGMPSYREEAEPSVNCYITVTTAPSLQGCKDCVRVAASYEEDEMAEAWNSCVRLSCLQHGMTVRASFGLLPPHPKFEPRISMKREGYVIINTGNILHSLHVELENLGSKKEEATDEPPNGCSSSPSFENSEQFLSHQKPWSEIQVGVSEFTFSSGPFSSPPQASNSLLRPSTSTIYYPTTSDSETEDYYFQPSPQPPPQQQQQQQQQQPRSNRYFRSERLEKVIEFADQLNPTPSTSHGMLTRRKRTAEVERRLAAAAEKAYADDDFGASEGVQEKLSTFRRKRLADKKYELTDEEFDGGSSIVNLSTFRKKRLAEKKSEDSENLNVKTSAKSPLRQNSDNHQVLRPLSSNQQNNFEEDLCLELSNIPELLSPGGMVNKSSFSPNRASTSSNSSASTAAGASTASTSSSTTSTTPPPPRMHYKFTRRYIEMDDEMTSVITDIEADEADDGSGPTSSTTAGGCYHSALPLEVHGAGYQFMPMISNSKAEKLSGRCVKVQQQSLDLEGLCLDMAQKLCRAADKNYWFCNDYDVEIVDVHPETGDVICVALILVQATVITKKVSPSQNYSLHHRQYQGGFRFCWNVDKGTCEMVDSEPLKEISAFKRDTSTLQQGIWHPARSVSFALQRQWSLLSNFVKVITNEAVIRGTSLKTIVDPDFLVAILLDNIE